MLGKLPRFASQCMPGSVPEFSFSDSKFHVLNLSINLPHKESDKGPQFPHLSKGVWNLSFLVPLALTCYNFPPDLQAILLLFKTPGKVLFVSLPNDFCRKITLTSPWDNVLRIFFW